MSTKWGYDNFQKHDSLFISLPRRAGGGAAMSRYCDFDDHDYEPWMEGQAAGALRNAIRGRRGQRLLRDLIAGLDALPVQELAAGALKDSETGCVCALGAVRLQRGADAVPLRFDPTDPDVDWRDLAEPFDISEILANAVVSQNEYGFKCNDEQSRRRRWRRVRDWAVCNLITSLEPEKSND
jgi:hypothetical protein